MFCRPSEDQEMESSATSEDQEGAVQRTSATLFGLLFCSVTGVFSGTGTEVGKSAKLWDENNLVKTTKD